MAVPFQVPFDPSLATPAIRLPDRDAPDAPMLPPAARKRPRYSFFDAASRRAHPLTTALLAVGAFGQQAPSYLGALEQQERQERLKQESLAGQIYPRLATLEQRQGHYDTERIIKGRDQAQAAAERGEEGASRWLDPEDEHGQDLGPLIDAHASKRRQEIDEKDKQGRVVAGEGGIYTVKGDEATPVKIMSGPEAGRAPGGTEPPSTGFGQAVGGPKLLKPRPTAGEEKVTLKEVEGGRLAKYDEAGNFKGYAGGPGGAPIYAKISDQDKQKAEAIKQVDQNIDAAEQLLTGRISGESFKGVKSSAAHWLPQTIAESFPTLDDFTAYEGLRQDIGAGLRPLVGVQNMRNIQEIDRILKNVATGAADPNRIKFAFQRVRSMVQAAKDAYVSTRPQIAHYLQTGDEGVPAAPPVTPTTAPPPADRMAGLLAKAHQIASQKKAQRTPPPAGAQ